MTIATGTRLGPYEVLAPLGAGGMGEVYRARDTRLSREVALKVLPSGMSSDPDRLKRFEKEAQAASSLNHPSIVTIHDIGESGAVSFIAMELVDGRTLRELLAEGALPTKKALAIAAQVADGLARAHEAGIVHRDLKPENVMVTKDGFAKILDFGLAKLTQPEPPAGEQTQAPTVTGATQPGVVMGTVGYMSPEQVLGQPLDFRSDQFAFGSVLYEIVTGKRAFLRASAPETLTAILREEPESLATAAPAAPVPLRWIVERCLAKEAEERYAATRDLARDLARLQQGLTEGSLSGALVAVEEPARPARRRYLLLAAAAALGAAAGAVAVWRPAPAPADFHAVTFRRGTIGTARFGPDGQTIVYTAAWEGKGPRLYSTRVDSTESTALPLPSALLGSISSTGMMAISVAPDTNPVLAEVSLAGGAPRELVEGVVRSDWAPDGKTLAVIHGRKIEFPIGKAFASAPEGYRFSQLRFAPDGRLAALETQNSTEGATSVVVFGPDGKARTVSSGWGYAAGLAWHPVTGEIWFSPRDLAPGSVLQLHAVMPSSGKARLVAGLPGIPIVQDIRKDGRVLMNVDDWHQSVMFGSVGSNTETNLTWLDFSGVADLSADGKTVLLDESGRGGGARGSVYLRRTDGSPATRLGDGIPLSLSPDGKWAITTPGTAFDSLVLIPTGVGEPKTIKGQGLTYSNALWIPGTRSLVYTAQSAGKGRRAYVQDVDGGDARPLTPEGKSFGLGPVSPDGKLVILRDEDGAPFIWPIDGGAPRPVAGVGPDDFVARWDASGQGLWVLRGDFPTQVLHLDLAGGRLEKTGEVNPSDRTGAAGLANMVLTADGKSYAYTMQRRLSTLFVVTGLK